MKKRVLCLALAALSVLCLCFAACSDEPQFVPPAFESTAVVGVPDIAVGEKGYDVKDAYGVYKVGVCGEVKVEDGKADVYLTNDAQNNVWLKLRVQDKNTGEILGETGLIKPGEYVRSVVFSKVPLAGVEISLRVMSYEPETYYSKGEITIYTIAS